MADALASGASGSNTVWVQVPSLALNMEKAGLLTCFFRFARHGRALCGRYMEGQSVHLKRGGLTEVSLA